MRLGANPLGKQQLLRGEGSPKKTLIWSRMPDLGSARDGRGGRPGATPRRHAISEFLSEVEGWSSASTNSEAEHTISSVLKGSIKWAREALFGRIPGLVGCPGHGRPGSGAGQLHEAIICRHSWLLRAASVCPRIEQQPSCFVSYPPPEHIPKC